MAVRSPAAGSNTLDGRFSNSVFTHSPCFSFKSTLLSDMSDITYRNSSPLFLRHLFKFACWIQYTILTAFIESGCLFWNVFQSRRFKVVPFYFWSSCDYQVLCWPFFIFSWLLWCFFLFTLHSPAHFYFTGGYFVYSFSHDLFLHLWILQLA